MYLTLTYSLTSLKYSENFSTGQIQEAADNSFILHGNHFTEARKPQSANASEPGGLGEGHCGQILQGKLRR